MALTPAEQHFNATAADLQRVVAEAEAVYNDLGLYTDEADRQKADAQLDAAQQRADEAWDAVQTERNGLESAREGAPWTWTGDRFENHYADDYGPGGRAPEYMGEAAARDWYENGNPQDGDRYHEYFVRDGQLWNDGKYSAADGSAEPYVVSRPSASDADADAACAAARAAAAAGDAGDESGDDETARSSADDQDFTAPCDEDGGF